MKRIALAIIGLLAVLGIVANCSGGPSLDDIARSNAASSGTSAPIVVFLPGTLASVLEDSATGERVWGRGDAIAMDPRTPEGLRLLSLPLDPVSGDLTGAADTVRATDVLRRANETVIGIPLSVGIYEDMLAAMGKAGLRETVPFDIPARGPSLTPFPYDWRRSITDGAQALGARLEGRGAGAGKVQIVAHSMGGLVALWYLMYGTQGLDPDGTPPALTWAGARQVDQAVLVGSPLRGSAIAIRNTVNGNKLGGPLVPTFPPTMLASHPSSFELMPRGDVLDGTDAPVLDPATWERFGWGLADPDERTNINTLTGSAADATEIAKARQAALIARGLTYHRAMDRPVEPPEGLRITVIAGTGYGTPERIAVPPDGGDVSIGGEDDGDGTVLLSSALAGFEDAATAPRKTVHRVEARHLSLMSDPAAFAAMLDAVQGR